MSKNCLSESKHKSSSNIMQGYLLNYSSIPSAGSNLIDVTQNIHLRKKRWFLFNAEFGKLYFYRSKEDIFPLGEIDINQSSFVVPNQSNGVDSFRFEIRSGHKQFILEASSSDEGFEWLRTLQQYRQNHFRQCKFQLNLQISQLIFFCFFFTVNMNENNKETIDKTYFSVSSSSSSATEYKIKSNQNSFEISPTEHFVKSSQQQQSLDPVDQNSRCYIQPKNQCIKTKIHSLQNNNNNKRAQSLPPVDREKFNKISSHTNTTDQCNNSIKLNSIVNNDRKSNKFFGGMFSQKNRLTNSTSMNSNNDINYQCPQCQIVNGRLIALRHDKIALEDEVKVSFQ